MYDGGYASWQGQEGEWFGELLAVPLDPRYPEPVTVVQFDQQYEALWAGTESGMVHTLQCPMLSRYASWQCHSSAVLDIQLLSDCAITVSSTRVALTTNGGYTRAAANLTDDSDAWMSAVVEPSTGCSRLLIAGSTGNMYTHDLITNKVSKQPLAVAGDGLALLRGPVGHRGAVAAATAGGRVLLLDPRTNWQPASSTLAHIGGVSALEVHGDMVATAGYCRRMGQVTAENMVKVFDCRSVLRPLFTLPCAAPGMLAWHPVNSMSLLCASATGLFMFADPSTGAAVETYQVDTAGDTLRSACISTSGDAVAFGGSGGYVHLWAASHQPRITARSRTAQQLTHPTRKAPNRTKSAITEQGPYSAVQTPQSLLLAAATAAGATSAAAAAAAVAGTRLLSDVPETLSIDVGKPPRLIDQALRKELKQVDNIGYIPNPHYSRSKAPGAARKAAMHLQHCRLKLAEDRGGVEAARAARVQSRLAGGGTLLPQRYKRLVIKAQSSMRFEEFDFTYYNKTKFAGLENDLPNCYCNALLQVLYFTPAFREAILQHRPEPSQEFCLTCELLFLFKMLLSAAGGLPCQALNLLRALRQNREAAALGLLEGTIGAGPGGLGAISPTPGSSGGTGLGGVGVGALVMGGAGQGLGSGSGGPDGVGGTAAGSLGHEWGSHAAKLAAQSALPKRVVTLCRFLLDHLYKEAGGEAAAAARGDGSRIVRDSSSNSARPEQLAKQQQVQKADNSKSKKGRKAKGAASEAGGSTTSEAAAAGQGNGTGGNSTQQCNANLAGVIQDLFGLVYRSDMTALSGPKKGTSKSRQLTTFQVDLSYPQISSSSKTAGSGSAGTAASPSPSAACSPVRAGMSIVRADSPAPGSCPASPLPPLSPSPSACPATPGASIPGLSLGPGADKKPGFGVLLANSLRAESVTKAWFDESCGYAYVRQARVPLVLPKTLVINCAMSQPSQAALWEPAKGAAAASVTPCKQQQQVDGSCSAATATLTPNNKVGVLPSSPSFGSSSGGTGTAAATASAAAGQQQQQQQQQQQHETPWLPWVLQVRTNPTTSQVDVLTAESLEHLAAQAQVALDAPIQATYELTAMICHIIDEDEAEQQYNGTANSVRCMMQSPTPTKSQAGSSSLQHQGHAVALIRVQQPYLDPGLVGGLQRFGSAVPALITVGSGAAAATAGGGGGVSRRLSGSGGSFTQRLSSQCSGAAAAAAAAGGGGSGSGRGLQPDSAGSITAAGFSLPDNLDDVFAELAMSTPQCSSVVAHESEGAGAAAGNSEGGTGEEAAALANSTAGTADNTASKQQQQQQSDSTAGGGFGQQWVVINDFSISPIPAYEVMNWYDAQKLPCLLFYTQVSALEAAEDLPLPEAPSPVDASMFEALCAAPPLQGANWRGIRTFTPLEFPREVPRPGFMVAIDAEFVAVARAETSFEGGVEVQLKPSRLALARVSVLRGAGPAAGTAFIDDYVACVEPVVDYLTRWSGIRPGDLDPSTSQRHLVSLKTAYLKLHHLLDAGCVFIGHGLKQDFRMLNLTVPPEQVRDTVELFSFRRQRKLSLRFLASYLLGLTIQTGAGAAGAAAAAAAAAATTASASAKSAKTATIAAAATAVQATGSRLPDGSKAGMAVSTASAAAVTATSKAGAAVATAATTVSPVLPGLVVGATGQGHDSIEDAATALALYNVYCKLQAEDKLDEKLHEMYRWGKQYGWEPVVHVNGVPQPPASAGLVSLTPVI